MTTETVKETRMLPDLELLLQLQGIDYDIGELERSKEYIPDMMHTLRGEVDGASRALAEAQESLRHTLGTQKATELELASKQEDLKRYQSQMMAIKTNKEYDALVNEIATLKKSISDMETVVLLSIEKGDGLKSGMGALESRSQELGTVNGAQLISLQQRLDSVSGKVAERVVERDKMVVKITKSSLAIYERVRRGKGTSALVPLKKGACGSCYKAIPPQRAQEIKRGDRLICCDSCGRILLPEVAVADN